VAASETNGSRGNPPAKPNDYKRGCSFQSNQIAALQHDLVRDKRLIAKRFCESTHGDYANDCYKRIFLGSDSPYSTLFPPVFKIISQNPNIGGHFKAFLP
jgi:hypothetical protein